MIKNNKRKNNSVQKNPTKQIEIFYLNLNIFDEFII
jgi:hypothetical protein